MRPPRALLLAPALALFDCNPIALPPSAVIFNTCDSAAACASYCPARSQSCTGAAPTCALLTSGENACLQSITTLPDSLVLVVDVPLGAPYAPGQTLIVTRAEITDSQVSATGECRRVDGLGCCTSSYPEGSVCVKLPPVPATVGAYEMSQSFAESIGVAFPAYPVSVPVLATLTPEWSGAPCVSEPGVPCPRTPIPAALVGLPLETIVATTERNTQGALPDVSILWEAYEPTVLSPSQGALSYFTAVSGLSPYTFVPPAFDPAAGVFPTSAAPAPVAFTEQVCVPSGVDAEGWTVFVRDPTTQRVLTSIGVLDEAEASAPPPSCPVDSKAFAFTLASIGPAPLDDIIVVAPRADQPMPVLAERYIEQLEVYQSMPNAVTVHGNVLFNGAPIGAKLHFVSAAIDVSPGCTIDTVYPSPLTYDSLTTATVSGGYSVDLPPGDYNVTIYPDPSSGAAIGEAHLAGQTGSGAITLPPLGMCGVADLALDLDAQAPIAVTGRALLVNGVVGSPLASATIDLTPALLNFRPLATTNSFNPPSFADAPGSFEVTTDAEGSYSFDPAHGAYVGPGTYDLTVRPASGTNLPWLVIPGVGVVAGISMGPLPDVYVPAPAPLTVALHAGTDDDTPLVSAVVRAYVFNPCAVTTGLNTNGPCYGTAIQVGEGLTDTNGALQLLLAPAPFVAGP